MQCKRPTAATPVCPSAKRLAIRLAALMEVHVVYVFTHNSIGLGEDGPTHQPVEQVASLRAIPRLIASLPGDAEETAVAWRVAMETRNQPVALTLTRQNVPTLDRKQFVSVEDQRPGEYIPADGSVWIALVLRLRGRW
jgi:transketolase